MLKGEVANLCRRMKQLGIEWPFGEGPFECVWMGERRPSGSSRWDEGWGKSLVEYKDPTKIYEVFAEYKGRRVSLSRVLWRCERVLILDKLCREYLQQVVETGVTFEAAEQARREEEGARGRAILKEKFGDRQYMCTLDYTWLDIACEDLALAEGVALKDFYKWAKGWCRTPTVSDLRRAVAEAEILGVSFHEYVEAGF